MTRLCDTDAEAGPFSERYVFPDAAPLDLSRVLLALERAGFVTRYVEEFGANYAETLRHRQPAWTRTSTKRCRPGRSRACPRLAPVPARREERIESGPTSIHQVRCTLGSIR